MRPLDQIIRTNAEADRIMRERDPQWSRETVYETEPKPLGPPLTDATEASN